MNEEWRAWRNGDYEVSNLGRVRRAKPGRRTHAGRLMNQQLLKIGYPSVKPTVNGKNLMMYVHRMVAECFIGPCPDGHEVNHKDGDKANPVASNLEYVSHHENMSHARRIGLSPFGSRHGSSKLTEEKVIHMRTLHTNGKTLGELSAKFGVAVSTVCQIVKRDRWRHV